MAFDQTKYTVQYVKDHYARIAINVKPEVKAELQRRAAAAGETLSTYLVRRGLEDEVQE